MIGKFIWNSVLRIRIAWLALPLLLFLLQGCSDEEVTPKEQFSAYQNEVMDYFIDVALGFEFGNATKVTRKWKTEVKIFIGGDKTPEMLAELDRIIAELHELTNQFTISITPDSSQSNYYLYLGPGTSFAERFPPASQNISANWGLFYVYFNSADEIYSAVMYVDIDRAKQAKERKHLLREEFTQSLGIARDSDKYPLSIFYGPWTTGTEYAPIDRDLIRLLYHPFMYTGLNETTTREVLKDLVKKLNIGA